jgi:hypothetical protein
MAADYADDKTMVIHRPRGETSGQGYQPRKPSVRQPDIWFEAENVPDKKILLPEGVPVTVGRSEDQDLPIADQTMSRNHLVLTRRGSKVMIEIKGLNGLTLNDVAYKNQVIDVVPPVSFLLGVLPFRVYLEEEVDEDATIMVNTGHGAPNYQSFQQPKSQNQRIGSNPSRRSDGRSHDLFQNGHGHESPAHSGPVSQPAQGHPPQRPEPAPRTMNPPDYTGSSPAQKYSSSISHRPDAFSFDEHGTHRSGNSMKTVLMVGACILAIFLVGVGGYAGWKKFIVSNDTDIVQDVQITPENQSIEPEIPSETESYGYDLYGILIQDARDALKSGYKEDACEFLKGIPKGDINFRKALEIARQIEGCQLSE